MSVEDNKAARLRYIEALSEAPEHQDLGGYDELFNEFFAPEWAGHVAGFPDAHGLEAARETIETQLKSFSAVRFTIHDLVGEGDKVATRWTLTGIHTGESFGLPATHKRFTFGGTRIDRFIDGKTVESWEDLDVFGLMQQLGKPPSEK